MELKTAQITSNQIVCHSDTQITLENDMNVPDSKPDIDKIIKIEGNILSNSVVALDGRAGIKGTLDYFILYTSSDDIVPVHNLSGSINFDESVGLDEVSEGDDIDCHFEIDDCQANLINSRKLSINAIIGIHCCKPVSDNYEERGQYAVLLKPRTDNRDGEHEIKSRIGLEAPAEYVDEFLKEISETWSADSGEYRYHGKKVDAVLIDEAQFLSPEEVDTLSDIVDFYGIPVLCYGLRADFQTHLFPGSRRLMEIADIIEEVPTVCWCGRRAQCNTRYADGKIVREGAQIFLGSNESYVALCRKHYKEGKLWKEDE